MKQKTAKNLPREVIEYTQLASNLGVLCIAGSYKGVRAILPGAGLSELRHRFPSAEFVPAGSVFQAMAQHAVAEINQPGSVPTTPLDVRGTDFQQRVWQALRGIPIGTTVSYSQVAAQLGLARAVRAVASACAANLHAVLIPCHRVLRTDGALSGYRWGVEMKRALLVREKAILPTHPTASKAG